MTNEVRACYLDMGFVLNGQPNGQKFPGYDKPGDYTPEVRQDYVLPDWAKKYFAQWLRFSARLGALYVTGPSGCGKTSAIKQVAARLTGQCMSVPLTDDWRCQTLSGICP